MSTPTIDEKLKQVEAQIAQQTKVVASSTEPPKGAGSVSWWTTTSAMTISSVVLAFGLIVVCLATYLIRVGKEGEVILRVFGTTLVVVLAVFLVVAGYSDTQIAPVIGLLGTIAGYLLGRTPRNAGTPDKEAEKDSEGEKPESKKVEQT